MKEIGLVLGIASVIGLFAVPAGAAYHHMGEADSVAVLEVYPELEGTKLDSCAMCHTGGAYEKKPGVWVDLGSCQWCHHSYGCDGSGDIAQTLNPYGMDYLENGRDASTLSAIEGLDSDGDGFTSREEIDALRFAGDADDDPGKVPAPCRVYSLEELEAMEGHRQILLMNTRKSGDFYAEYSGVAMEDLLEDAGTLASATGIVVFAPDGWSQYHPLEGDPDPLLYPVRGVYPEAVFHYEEEADAALNPGFGWCTYPPGILDRLACLPPEAPIPVAGGLRMLLAYARDGGPLAPGELTPDNKLDGEGPFRVVPPQKIPGPPDQGSTSDIQDVVWPFDPEADHNAGYSTRTVNAVRVDPLPPGATDIDILEAGWSFVDQKKVLVYGALDALPTVRDKLAAMTEAVWGASGCAFQRRVFQWTTLRKVLAARWLAARGKRRAALHRLEKGLLPWIDGCAETGAPDGNDWVVDPDVRQALYWAANECRVLLGIGD